MIANRFIALMLVASLGRMALAQATAPATMPDQTLRRLTDSSKPNEQTAKQLLDDLKSSPLIRESALRRLARFPLSAGNPAIDVLTKSDSLETRNSIIELLRRWHAPLEGIDAWALESLTPARVEALRAWSANVKDLSTTQPAAFLPDELRAARVEMDRMLTASSDEAFATRERLARFGETLLPDVYARLANVAIDDHRSRLTGLRYRLVISEKLALMWNDGIARLASIRSRERIAALDELSQKVTPADQRLLLELFSDPDPFVRERSLRLLKSVGGAGMVSAMSKLLSDPEKNVRVAVLKDLSENPSPQFAAELIKYVDRETDPDLLVHAARVLRNLKSPASAECLMKLLEHESWRVRAEAIDGLKDSMEKLLETRRAAIRAHLVKLLDDPDGFVIARAVSALQNANLPASIAPMVAAVEKHPEIAADVVAAITNDPNMATQAIPHLKHLCANADASVRIAGIRGVCAATPDGCGDQLLAGLRDADMRVRAAAAGGMFDSLKKLGEIGDAQVDESFTVVSGELVAPANAKHPGDWLTAFRAGKGRPAYVVAAVPLLKPLLESKSPEDRTAAALSLVAARDEKSLDVLMREAKAESRFNGGLIAAMPWLGWEGRARVFSYLAAGNDESLIADATEAFAQSRDPRVAAAIWPLLGKDASFETFEGMVGPLRHLYFGDNYFNPEAIPPTEKKAAIEVFNAQLAQGSELQKTAALTLLLIAAPETVAAEAQRLVEDPKSSEWMRIDALQIELLSMDGQKGGELAAKLIEDPVLAKVAIPYLAMPESAERLRGSMYLYSNHAIRVVFNNAQPASGPDVTKLPHEPLVKVMNNPDDEKLGAAAGYLLARQGDRDGLKKLESYWRMNALDSSEYQRLVFLAAAGFNDDSLTPLLEEIYRKFDPHNFTLNELRIAVQKNKGPKIEELRKKMAADAVRVNLFGH